MPVGDIIPELVLVLTAVSVLIFSSFAPHRRHRLAAPFTLFGIALAGILLILQLGENRLTFSGVWALDGVSVWARILILASTALCVLISPDWMRADKRHGEYYSVLLFGALGAMALAAAADLLQLTIGVLLSSVTGYTLAAYHRNWPRSLEAGMKYFLIGALANAVLVIGVIFVFGMIGHVGYGDIADAAKFMTAPSPLLLLGLALMLMALSFKLGAVPAHFWMPDVAEGAPAPAATFLTVIPKIGGAVALARLIDLFPEGATALRPLAAIMAAATMTLGNLGALWQSDVRRLLGYSAVSQSGYALMAVCAASLSESAPAALLIFLIGYAAANITAFAVVTQLRGRTALQDYAGLFQTRTGLALVMTLALLSLVGIPPLIGFFGKLGLFVVTIDGGYAWLAAVAAINTVISLFYYLRVVAKMYFPPAAGKPATLGRVAGAGVYIGAAATAGFAIAAALFYDRLADATLLP